MTLGKQDTDKIVRTIEDSVTVYADVKEKKQDDGKITWNEWVAVAASHAGKAFRLITDIEELGEELVDLEAKEAPEIVEAVKLTYSTENPYIDDGAEHTIKGMLHLKEGLERFIQAKKWEEENK